MPKPKKPKPRANKNDSVSELIKSNMYLHQYCDFISTEMHRTAFELQKVISHIVFLENRLLDTQKMVNLMVAHITPTNMDKIKKEMGESHLSNDKNQDNKIQGFHDNVTKRCPICHSIGTIKDSACKECGYNKK